MELSIHPSIHSVLGQVLIFMLIYSAAARLYRGGLESDDEASPANGKFKVCDANQGRRDPIPIGVSLTNRDNPTHDLRSRRLATEFGTDTRVCTRR